MGDSTTSIGLVTGASDGIGKETAKQLIQNGVQVIIGSRNLEKGQRVVEEFAEAGLKCHVIQLEITDDKSVHEAVREIDQRFGRLDILVNNAGIALDRGPLSEMPIEDFIATFQTNVIGSFRVTQACLPLLRRSQKGRIVNVSSGLASLLNMTDPNSQYYHVAIPAYASSKAAVNAMTVHLARELAESGIKVNAVEPGLTATRYVSLPGAQPVEVGAEASIKYALIDDNGPTGCFFDRNGMHNW